MQSKPRIGWVGPFLAFWAIGTACGFIALERHANAPGAVGHAPERIAEAGPRPRLEVFLHPACPCSRSTATELARLVDSSRGRLDVHVHFLAPHKMPASWVHGPLYHQAATIPGVQVSDDPDGRDAQRFGAETSGQVLLYDSGGKLIFKGGITASRGHEGDNAGSDAILAYLTKGTLPVSVTPVFGCALFHRTS